jgi:hypothetical protein
VDHNPFTLNPATVRASAADRSLSIDLINAVPEVDEHLEKVDLGPLALALEYRDGAATRTQVLGSLVNTRAAYEARAGLADFQVAPDVWPLLDSGRLKVVQVATGAALLDEAPVVVETDDRATYLEQGHLGTLRLRGWVRGRPAAGASVRIRQFSTTHKTNAPIPPATPVVRCPDAVTLDADGAAAVPVQGLNSGCCTLRFLPAEDEARTDYFGCVRVLPTDDYSHLPDSQVDFALIYREIFQYYHLLHPAMDALIDLSSEAAVRARLDPVRARVAGTAPDDPAFMPRTRDLSAGKLALLLRWCALVAPPANGGPAG